jgi:hypothetical protein
MRIGTFFTKGSFATGRQQLSANPVKKTTLMLNRNIVTLFTLQTRNLKSKIPNPKSTTPCFSRQTVRKTRRKIYRVCR